MSDIISQMRALASKALPDCTAKIRKRFNIRFIEVLILYIVMDKTNFTSLQSFGKNCEKTYRHWYEDSPVDVVSFNFHLAQKRFEGSHGIKAIAIDPSYITKYGKCTPWFGKFWSGTASMVKRGLEILGVGIIDTELHDCMMLGGYQTPSSKELTHEHLDKDGQDMQHLVGPEAVTDFDDIRSDIPNCHPRRPYHKQADAKAIEQANRKDKEHHYTLVDWYLHIISCLPPYVHSCTNLIVADAFFAKQNFLSGLAKLGYHLVSRMRDDAALWYLYNGPRTGKRGAPKKYAGKVDYDSLDMNVFHKLDYTFDNGECFEAEVFSKSLKAKVKVVIWYSQEHSRHKIFFSDDTSLSGEEIISVYRTRFQIEFEFRTAKGFASLNKCQARSTAKLRTHFNMSFASVNCLKLAAAEKGIPFSISNLKTLVHGEYLMQRFICVSGIEPDSEIIDKFRNEIYALTTLERPAA